MFCSAGIIIMVFYLLCFSLSTQFVCIFVPVCLCLCIFIHISILPELFETVRDNMYPYFYSPLYIFQENMYILLHNWSAVVNFRKISIDGLSIYLVHILILLTDKGL